MGGALRGFAALKQGCSLTEHTHFFTCSFVSFLSAPALPPPHPRTQRNLCLLLFICSLDGSLLITHCVLGTGAQSEVEGEVCTPIDKHCIHSAPNRDSSMEINRPGEGQGTVRDEGL